MERERKSSRRRRVTEKDASKTLPSSPSHHSSSSSDFEFITISNTNSSSHHHKPFFSSSSPTSNLCPADELFYKGQLLPLHLSPRLSMVQTLLLSSSSSSTSSSSDTTTTTTTTTTTSRDSNSSNDSNSSFSASDLFLLPESARPSSVNEEDEFKINQNYHNLNQIKKPTNKYFSLISSVFRKNRVLVADQENSSSMKKMSTTNSAKEVISKYLKKVRPLYEKLSQKQRMSTTTTSMAKTMNSNQRKKELDRGLSQSFSENLRYPRRKNCVSSCPSSMRSSPSRGCGNGNVYNFSDSSSMEELQSAIQGAIAHCKNSMIQKKILIQCIVTSLGINYINKNEPTPTQKVKINNDDSKLPRRKDADRETHDCLLPRKEDVEPGLECVICASFVEEKRMTVYFHAGRMQSRDLNMYFICGREAHDCLLPRKEDAEPRFEYMPHL